MPFLPPYQQRQSVKAFMSHELNAQFTLPDATRQNSFVTSGGAV